MLRFNWKTAVISACLVAASATVVSVQPTDAGGLPGIFRSRTSVEKLAHKIDELQEEIDELGTVVVKQPDVWGEARLTRHRAQYEEKLNAEAGNFKETIQANLKRSDQAFLLQTLALQAALSGRQAAVIAPDSTSAAQRIPGEAITATAADGSSTTTSGPAEVKPSTAPALSVPTNAPDLTNAQTVSSTAGGDKQPGIALEPVIKLDQLSRYLNHLNQLRRINEGDDTADAPGYSMNLMRFPVSVLPGTKTREGYGAEVTVTVTPRVSDKLLESTFQSLVINDLLDTLTLPVVKLAALQPSIKAAQAAKADAAAAAAAAAADADADADAEKAKKIAAVAQDAAEKAAADAEKTRKRINDEIIDLEKNAQKLKQKLERLKSKSRT
jgi:hypothetical protein